MTETCGFFFSFFPFFFPRCTYRMKKNSTTCFTSELWKLWKDLFVQRRWTALNQCEGKDKTGKNVNMLTLTRNPKLCSSHLDKEKISTDRHGKDRKGTNLQNEHECCHPASQVGSTGRKLADSDHQKINQ